LASTAQANKSKCAAGAKKVHVDDKQWLEVEETIEALQLFLWEKPPKVFHGICISSKEPVMETLS
jgi:hypothetical protein